MTDTTTNQPTVDQPTADQPTVELSADFMGETIRPGDAGFDKARAVYNRGIDKHPALIVRPTGAADVMDAVNYARTARLPLTARCGGHSVAGTSANEGGVLIDLSSLKGVHVDPDRGTAIAQAGVLWGEYDRETQLYGRATPGGRVTTTGLGGFTLGGGYGWLSTKFGLSCDNLVAADIVTADGRLVHVSEDENEDLLWGLRGAGANFGVVTSYELRVHEIPPLLLAGMLVVPNQEAAGFARAYRDYIETAPEDLATAMVTILAPPEDFVPPELVGQPMVALVVAYIGDPEEALETVAPLRELAAGGMDLVQPMPYTALQAMIDGFNPKGMLNYHRGIHLARLSDEVIDEVLEVGSTIHSPLTQGVMFRHGGAIARVPEDATAAGNRAAQYMAHPIAAWDTADKTDYEMDWVRRFSAAVEPDTTGGVYLNFEPGTTLSDVKAGFGDDKYARLVALKDEWDPTNLFRSNHNIAPTGWEGVKLPEQPVR
ncbi:MAG TPA: FAD-binding oxidoreductase [Nocardioidaceae bacterium]|nr:FAD-binding oxidoreductase [Nocardioidaceae bacterium]